VDLSWQLTLDGDPLSEAEAEAVAAAEGVVRLRERWVLIDPAPFGVPASADLVSSPAPRR
jgi:hypothetical protein